MLEQGFMSRYRKSNDALEISNLQYKGAVMLVSKG